ncbi:MAG: hypothetical protein KIC64_05905 [Prevotella buccae]|jgi:hypothetical protein|uniref:hypothetical protein n=1 Tax=Segatella buccae TaxID=28126 RepID=UPI0001C4091E|nr:hypothetical protein [Segatella buccae]EFC75547.1 hypothetical protein HMPREF0649_01410 [Segatella buccae D17]MBS5895341.1 hypothetical protein [Segatella buccae]
MKEEDGAEKRECEPMERITLFPVLPETSPAVPHGFERCTYAIIFADGNWKDLKQQTITI